MSSPQLPEHDPASDPDAWATALSVSREAIELYCAADVIDLHVDSFIWSRVFGYDLSRRHGRGLFGARFFSQVDVPRMREARIGSALWAITTNPLRSVEGRARIFERNFERLRELIAAAPEQWTLVTTADEYAAARARGQHAAFISIQGGHALDGVSDTLIGDGALLAVTLVHLSTSSVGTTSSPIAWSRDRGLSAHGRALVERLDAQRIFVDLAHVSRAGFFDALDAHDRTRPIMVSHTGLSGAHPLWRNIDDAQLKAVAETGGVVGVIFHSAYLGDSYLGGGRVARIAQHLHHIVRTVGADYAALGSDWDGLIITPRDMPTCLELPRLVQALLDLRVSHDDILKILGRSFLRALRQLRG
jgi:membrane dipeptidase